MRPVADRIRHPAVFGRIVRRVQASGLDAEMAKRRHLIAHQRDQGRDHEGQAFAHEGGQLVAQGFAGAGRHDGEHVLAGEHRAHDVLLPVAEAREAEDVVENFERIGHGSGVAEGPDSVNAALGIFR